jgi:serine-type D-Ala-D-Ala endopeptidase (penicillin-binding protein 7)
VRAFRHCLLALALALVIGTGPVLTGHAAAAPRRGAKASGSAQARSGRALMRSPSRRPAQRAMRRPAPRRPGIPWLRGSLPNVQAQGSLVIDLQDGEELFSRQSDVPRPIASISKLAATLTVVERGLVLDQLTTVSRADLDVARGGARSRLVEGTTLSNRDLLHAALLGSDNRAVSALGRAVGLSAAELAAAMTGKARELGCKGTRFEDPTGLSPQNVSTPREAIVLLRAVMDHPVLGPITRRLEYDARPVGRAPIRYSNTHRPAARSNTTVLGGKTGFNNAARYCLVLAAEVGGRTLGMAFLGTEGELTRFGDVGRVSDWVVAYRARRPETTSAAAPALASARIAPQPSAPVAAAVIPPPLPVILPASPAEADQPLPPGAAQPPPATLESPASGPPWLTAPAPLGATPVSPL